MERADGRGEAGELAVYIRCVAVCTGSRAGVPDLPGIAEVGSWISRDATSALTVPVRLAIVVVGPVGVEMSTAWLACEHR